MIPTDVKANKPKRNKRSGDCTLKNFLLPSKREKQCKKGM